MTIYGLNMDGLGADSRPAQIRRALFGAWYGFLSGLAFVFVAAFVDIWLNPDLPFGVDWGTFMLRLLVIGTGLALVGAVTCWWHEAWQGLLSGTAAAAVLALIAALFQSNTGAGLKFVVLIFILIPVAAMTLPVAYILRWLTERHAAAWHKRGSILRVAMLMIAAILLGAGSGYFMKSSPRGVQAAQLMNELLQNPMQEKSPLARLDGMVQHQNLPYKLYQQVSQFSTEGFDVTAEYADGFTVRCTIVMYPGTKPFISGCSVGK